MTASSTGGAHGPLTGVRVLEMGSFVAGPFAGQLLADMGADVIKVEEPLDGDAMRRWGIHYEGRGIWWSALARNKRSVAINLRHQEGRMLVRQLALSCDVVLENFTPGRLEEWGLGYDQLSQERPQLVMTRVSGFGQFGPRSFEPGFGSIGEAMGGLRELTGSADRPPSRAALSLGDQLAGLFAAYGTVAALRRAEHDGRGQVVDVALYESVFAITESLVADYELAGVVRSRSGGALPGVAPSNAYPTADGREVMIAANADAVFARLAAAMGQPALAADERYRAHEARGARMDELDAIVAGWSSTLDFEQLNRILEEHSIPHGLIYRAPDIAGDPQYVARQMVQRVFDPELGADVAMAGIVPKLSETPGSIRSAGPQLGQHTYDVLAELGIAEPEEIVRLVEEGVIRGGGAEKP